MFRQDKTILEDIERCVGCGAKPVLWHYDKGLWYVECSNPNCKKHVKWSCMGASAKCAVDVWREVNRPIKRGRYEGHGSE